MIIRCCCRFIFLFSIILMPLAADAVNWPLKICGSGSDGYLCDQSDTPFLVVADTAWSIAGELNPTEVVTYLSDREDKGFTAILMNAIEHNFSANAPNNYNNDAPFSSGVNDWSTPNEDYWTHLDYILAQAKNRNILVFLVISYIGYQCDADEGWGPNMLSQSNSDMQDYGEFLGNRYKNQGNIIWVYGGDEDCSNCSSTMCDRITYEDTGIHAQDTGNHLRTAHSGNGRSAMDDYNSIVDLNNAYSYGSPDTEVRTEYQRGSAKPLFFIEGYYENEYSSTIGTWQSQAMTAHLGGALVGQFFGNCPIWPFDHGGSYCALTNWENYLDSTGSVSMGHIKSLMKSRKWWTLTPDYSNVTVTSSKGSGLSYHATARESSGETIMVWCPNTNQVTVDMTKISGTQAKAWWYDPDNNSAQEIGNFETKGARSFTPTKARMVLVIDDASLDLPGPGRSKIVYIGPPGCYGKTPCYTTIQQAVTDVSTGTVLLIPEDGASGVPNFSNEDILLNSDKKITLFGGWNTGFFSPNMGMTTIKSLTIQNGTIVSDNIVLKEP